MNILNLCRGLVGMSSNRYDRTGISRRRCSRRRLQFEQLESRQMLSITPGEFPITGDDTLTAVGLAIDPANGPQTPPFPPGLENAIDPSLWRVVAVVETAVDSGDLQIIPGSTEPADVDLTNVAVANVNQAGKILVYADMNTLEQTALDAIMNLGSDIVSASTFLSVVETWVPYDKIDDLAALTSVDFVRLPMEGVLQTGLVNSAGDAILDADDVRAQLGVDGTGIRIGVISDGVSNRAMVQGGANPDLPAITVNPARPGTGDEGTAMLEIIHDLAPGAQLFFSSGIAGQVAMVDSINWLVGQGVDIIVDDLGFFAEHYFSDDPIAQTVNNAINAGVVYLTAAGNQAQTHYQGQWSVAGGVHDFDPTAGVDNLLDVGVVPANGVINVFLQWSDAQGGSGNDYNLGLWDVANGAFVALSTGAQTGAQSPFEAIQWTNTTGAPRQVAVVVDDFNNPAGRELELFVIPRNFGLANLIDNDRTTIDSVFGHQAVLDAVTIAAIDAADPGNDTIEFFSNQGASTIYTDFATQTSTTRNTVDGAGIDGVQTRIGQLGFFNNPFFGTSAAAPHIAAISALMLEINPSFTPTEISAVLNATAVDIGAAGYNNDSGFGRFDALAAAQAVPVASGDYNGNGTADAADYTVWRDGLGQTGLTAFTSADGNGDGQITQADYDVWKAHFGQTFPVPGAGSGSTLSESALAATSQRLQGTASPQTPAETSAATTSVAAKLKAFHPELLVGTTVPSSASIGIAKLRPSGVTRNVSFNTSARDAGLLAWLSAQPASRFDDHGEWADDIGEPYGEEIQRYHHVLDDVMNALNVPFTPGLIGV